MTFLVEDADDLDNIAGRPVEQNVGPNQHCPQAGCDVISGPPQERTIRSPRRCRSDFQQELICYVGRRYACIIAPNLTQILLAAEAQRSRRSPLAMLGVKLPDHTLDVEFLAQTSIQFVNADLNFRSQGRERLDSFKHFTADQLLRRLRKPRSLFDRKFERFGHRITIAAAWRELHRCVRRNLPCLRAEAR
jgi:hypothetical protein